MSQWQPDPDEYRRDWPREEPPTNQAVFVQVVCDVCGEVHERRDRSPV